MIALLTSCGRPDLLMQTLTSLFENQKQDLKVFVHEDAPEGLRGYNDGALEHAFPGLKVIFTNQIGQHKSIELFLKSHYESNEKYFLHLEDDWHFNNHYDWIGDSVQIMEEDHKVIKVLARIESPHPCKHDRLLIDQNNEIEFGELQPWENEGIRWDGFSWNPGVTRLDYLRRHLRFPDFEQHLAANIRINGFKVMELKKKVYHHIGEGRNTTQNDPAKKNIS